ncbi:MAG: hypothetical protein DRP73_05310, partial [Candidatus Omnitrophota bacterium]
MGRIKQLSVVLAVCWFLLLFCWEWAQASMKYIPEGLDYYGIWERNFAYTTPTKTEWDSGKFVDPEVDFENDCEDWVYNYAYNSYGYWKVDYEFHLENVERPGWVKNVYFYAEWTSTQDKFDPYWLETEIYDIPKLEGEQVAKTLLDNDMDGNYDALYLEYFIPYQPKGEFITVYEWDGPVGEDPWHIEYAEMGAKCVPIPGTLLLLGSGLVGLVGLGR